MNRRRECRRGVGSRVIVEGLRVSDPGTAEVRLVFTHLRGAQSVMDGGWWPRTRDVSKELPALLTAVGSRFGVVVARVSLSATVWDATPEQISVGDRIVQVAWFRAPEARTIRLLGDRFWHVDLLVIPPGYRRGCRSRAGVGGRGGRRRRVAGHFRGGGGFIMRPVISFVVFLGSSGER